MTHKATEPSALIAAIVLAAGRSTRMGRPKMALPWGIDTVIGQVIRTLWLGGVQRVVVVTGGDREAVELALTNLPDEIQSNLQLVFNPEFQNGEMLTSLQVGVRELSGGPYETFLLALGDQPQIQVSTIQAVITAYRENRFPLIVPSYTMRRGHPWLVDRSLWAELLEPGSAPGEQNPITLRDFLNRHSSEIHYVTVSTDTILADLDTPEQYRRQAP